VQDAWYALPGSQRRQSLLQLVGTPGGSNRFGSLVPPALSRLVGKTLHGSDSPAQHADDTGVIAAEVRRLTWCSP